MKNFTPSNNMEPDNARSICQFLTSKNIIFSRLFHKDYKGVDYIISADILDTVLKELSMHQHIGYRFHFNIIDGAVGKFTAFLKDEDDDE